MTIHDELVLKLIKPNRLGQPIGSILDIIGSSSAKTKCVLEELYYRREERKPGKVEYEKMAPDIVATNLETSEKTAIEIESDMKWDFAKSLRQVKKYRRNKEFQDVVVIIPKRYERFARLYKNEGVQVYLWEATRLWKCANCGKVIPSKRTAIPKCSDNSCKKSKKVLIGLEEGSEDIFTAFR